MQDNATRAAGFLKAFTHPGRLILLCNLAIGEKSVTELMTLLAAPQSSVSQQLSRLRLEGLVVARREGHAVYYRLADERSLRILMELHGLLCGTYDWRDEPPGVRLPSAGLSG